MGKQWKQWETLLFLGSKITADGDCSHEIERHLFLGRKAVTNLDTILKTKDITLPSKAHLVKAMVFPVVMYECESWIIKKAEHQIIDAFELWCWRRLLRSPLDCKEIQPVHPKGEKSFFKKKINYFNWRLITLQYYSGFCHILTWISMGVHVFPILDPFHLPPSSYPSGSSQCTSP